MHHHVRIARPVHNLEESAALYIAGLGFRKLGSFQDHEGFDGVMIGDVEGSFHFEFTVCRTHPVTPSPTQEDLIVFYVPDPQEWSARCDAMIAAGFNTVPSFNPYWDAQGKTFEDRDGYRVVIQNSEWTS